MIIQGVVRLPFITFQDIAHAMAERFSTFLIAQHDADDDIKSTHCHFLVDISGSFGNADSLRKNYFKKRADYGVISGKAMELHNVTQKEKLLYDRWILARYIMKGDTPIIFKGFTQIDIDKLKEEWRPKVQAPEAVPAPEAPKQKKKSCYKVLIEMLEEPDAIFGRREGSEDFLTYDTKPKDVRVLPSELMCIVIRVLKRNEMTPHPQQIDRFVGSMYNMVEDENYDAYQHCSISRYTAYKFRNA